jgi:hypothetical protein
MEPNSNPRPQALAISGGAMNHPSPPYLPPQLLRDLHLLNVLELTGTTHLAGQWLAVSQPTVSRRYRRLAADFGLKPTRRGAKVCRFGSSMSLRQLRHGLRWHRFEAGLVGLASDPLHQGLLEGLPSRLPMPMRFRPANQWGHLVREAVLDAALVSSLELEVTPSQLHPAGKRNGDGEWEGADPPPLDRVHLGQWPLSLALARASHHPMVLAPAAALAPGLLTLLENRGLPLATTAGADAHDPMAWLARMASCGLAAPVPAHLLDQQLGPFGQLERLESYPRLREHLWLLLPGDWRRMPVLQRTVAYLLQLAQEAGARPGAPASLDDEEALLRWAG